MLNNKVVVKYPGGEVSGVVTRESHSFGGSEIKIKLNEEITLKGNMPTVWIFAERGEIVNEHLVDICGWCDFEDEAVTDG